MLDQKWGLEQVQSEVKRGEKQQLVQLQCVAAGLQEQHQVLLR